MTIIYNGLADSLFTIRNVILNGSMKSVDYGSQFEIVLAGRSVTMRRTDSNSTSEQEEKRKYRKYLRYLLRLWESLSHLVLSRYLTVCLSLHFFTVAVFIFLLLFYAIIF
jgi:hypothetical protein